MTVQNPNRGGHRLADDVLGDAPQHYEPWHYHSATASHQMMDFQDFGVPRLEVPSLTTTISAILTAQGYTVIPPRPSRQPRNLVPAAHIVEELAVQYPSVSRLGSELGIHEHPAGHGPIPDTAFLREVQANAPKASNGDAGKNNNRSKKKNTEKKKQQEQKVCPLFQASGQCRYGDNCKFSHLVPDTLPPRSDTVDPEPPKKEQDSPIDLFFSKYPEFDYMPNKPLWDEFDRMGQHFKWPGPKRDQVRKGFRDALVDEFNYVYGTDESNLESWGKLCQTMGLSAPKTLKQAHKVVQGAHVNLVALIQSPRTGEPVEVFKSAQDMRQFTAKVKWTFPQQHAQAGGLLNMLLRKIGGPTHGHRARGKKEALTK